MNLHERYETILSARRVVVSSEEADLIFSIELPAPAPVAWHYLTDPEKKSKAFNGYAIFTPKSRPGGRHGPGASNHCAHGKDFKGTTIETFLDWRPFEYLTVESVDGKMVMRETYKLEPSPDGRVTRLQVFTQIVSMPFPHWLKRLIIKLFVEKKLTTPYFAVAQTIAEERDPDAIEQFMQSIA